jgi:hypothetical protein
MHILHVVGARPNFMKAAPVLHAHGKRSAVKQTLVHTGQHYDANMSEVFFSQLEIPAPDVNLGVGSGSHAQQTAVGAFLLVIAGIWLSTAADAGQLKSTSNTGPQSASVQAETGRPQTAQVAKELPSCTPEMSAQSDARPSAHTVTLSWKASPSPGVVGYNVYRRDKASPAFGKINQKPIATTSCIDYFVQLRHKYYYYVVAADHLGARDGGRSNIAQAKIPRK